MRTLFLTLVVAAAFAACAKEDEHVHDSQAAATNETDAGKRQGAKTVAANPDEGLVGERLRNWRKSQKYYSQFNEELIIRDFFKDRRDGFFLDVGSADALQLSTTAYLERHLGWHGIGIDALAEWAPGYAKHRPNTKFMNYLVNDKTEKQVSFFRSDEPTLSSSKKYWVESAGPRKFAEVKVDSITLNDLLEREGVEKVDFLSMDIEDAEPDALKGFDIQRFAPELVCIEAHKPVRKHLLAYFGENGYQRVDAYRKYDSPVHGEVNWYFVPAQVARDRFHQK